MPRTRFRLATFGLMIVIIAMAIALVMQLRGFLSRLRCRFARGFEFS